MGVFLAILMATGLWHLSALADDQGGGDQSNSQGTSLTATHGDSGGSESENGSGSKDSGSQASGGESEQESNGNSSSGSAASLSVGNSGETSLNGAKLVSVSGQNLSVTVFGLPITVSVASSTTQFTGVSSASDLATGDILSIKGSIDSATGIVAASEVRDESQRLQQISSIQAQIQALLDEIHKLQAQVSGQ